MLGARFCLAAQRLVEGGQCARVLLTEGCKCVVEASGPQFSNDSAGGGSGSVVLRLAPPGSTLQLSRSDSMINTYSRRDYRSFNTSASVKAEDVPSTEHRVTFPPPEAGGVILGPLQPSEDARTNERIKKIIRASIFDDFYQDGVGRTGRKALGRALKGDYIGDYYMDKITDPLMTNPDGREEAAIRAERNARGFKRRRPQKQTKKGK